MHVKPHKGPVRLSGRVVGRALAILMAAGPAATLADERIEIPIKQTTLSDGQIRYSIPVVVGGAAVTEAMLDTGSSGLRVLQGAVPESAYSVSDQSSVYRYTSGVRLNGVIAKAVVAIGGAPSDAPIPIQIVRSVDCASEAPRCPASRVSAEDYRIGGDGLPRQGFRAIIGVNMGKADAVNPLTRIGTHSWIILLPRPGDRNPGTMVLNPDSKDRSGYALFHTDEVLSRLPAAGGFHDAIPGCLVGEQDHKRICGPTLLDTGAPGLQLSSSNPSDLSGSRPGNHMDIAFKDDQGAELNVKFTADADRPSKITSELRPNQPRTRISAGSLPYFGFSVLYDGEQSVVGLKAR
jgi:hypothetical protein